MAARVAMIEKQIATFKQQIGKRGKELASQQTQWENQQLAKLGPEGKDAWQVLKPTAAKAVHQKLTILEDNSRKPGA